MTKTLNTIISHETAGMKLVWDTEQDAARLSVAVNAAASAENSPARTVWTGSLLPAIELYADGKQQYVKASAAGLTAGASGEWAIRLTFGEYGTGTLVCETQAWGIRMKRLQAAWNRDVHLVSLQFGTRLLTETERLSTPRADSHYWPDWAAEGFCVPAAGSSPTHSFWRSWDMGGARLPLGSFGDAMGTPYAAAFPRPLYAAAMGGKHGWLAFGPGEVPDAPLTLHIQSATACIHYAYREDLWGAPDPRSRQWSDPLRLAWGETGYDALGALFDTFGPFEPKSPHHLRSFLCTWGDFKENRFDLKQIAERVSGTTPADMIVMDDSWETFVGSAEPDLELFPNFDEDMARFRDNGYELAFWQSVGWTDDPEAQGLTADDLLCGPDGQPRRWRWSGSPFGSSFHYLLDPSSARTRQLIQERTVRLVNRYKPAALKLDFGYGFPGPDAAVPRDPAYRGERLAFELLKLIYDAAKSVDNAITIIYYGIHPLMRSVSDLINLDDLGDAGDSAEHELSGHNQRCLWASLAARHGMAVNTSTGYYWDTLGSILLDTAVVGVNGLTLGECDNDGKRMTASDIQRWTALQNWHRRTCGWKPLLLDAGTGSLKGEPKLGSWGRLESDADAADAGLLTALALRSESSSAVSYPVAGTVAFTGNWALIAQDNADLSDSASVACIPFAAGEIAFSRPFNQVREFTAEGGKLVCVRTLQASELPEGKLVVTADRLASIVGYLLD
ncbi:hypothetical protein GZH47_30830 [Paenibacillus rhizovicinus]|uniref:Alpha-galactosidase n=1 Tax=Paenibacillus rhizovicinus TaxID=2704463 RepID=A0A6C0P7Z9_9BACL|nr:hypothetical protein [Paenibacillus rhizovicinus]QHW34760.1 hypothetical protein GZH47_30830 [Paenibacillus rhizovicinus]